MRVRPAAQRSSLLALFCHMRACAEKTGWEARALAHGLQSRAEDVTVRLAEPITCPSLSLPLADAGDRIPKAPRGHGS
jgi:hypothetical protein